MRKTPQLILAATLAISGCGSNSQQASDATVHRQGQPLETTGGNKTTAQTSSQTGNQSTTGNQTTQPPMTSLEGGSNRVIVTVNGQPITEQQLMKPLVEAYGLNMMLSLAMLEEAKQLAAARNVKVTPDDVKNELAMTLKKTFADAKEEDYPALLVQLLQSQNRTRPEFDIVIETNTYLRKVAEPVTKGRISDDQVAEAFKALYGETVRVRHIELANMQEVAEAKRRIGAGEPFEDVARAMSRNERTRGIGGALRPFSRNADNIPPLFRETAFGLKPGEVSDVVQMQGMYHLIKCEGFITPRAVKFEDVKESVRLELEDKLLQQQVLALRNELKNQLKTIRVMDPSLAEQFKRKLAEEDGSVTNRQEAQKRMEDERIARIRAAATQPSTGPSTMPAATLPTTQPEELRPPATMPAVPPTTGPAK